MGFGVKKGLHPRWLLEEKGNEWLQSVSCGLVEGGGVVMVELWRRGRGDRSNVCSSTSLIYPHPQTNKPTHTKIPRLAYFFQPQCI